MRFGPTIQAHLETCGGCQQTIERLAAGGVTWDRTAQSLGDKPAPQETALIDAVEKLQSEPTSADLTREVPARPIDDDLSFLQPTTKPNSLGRLDEFEILSVVGKGGFGIVLKAFDENLHRIVALKVMLPQMAASGTARQRFIKEAQAAAAITHENVVTIHKVEKNAKHPYLAMQFVSGQTLNEKIDRAGQLSLKEILRIGTQMAEGLAAAHKQGVVHRDIKPANVLLENGVERVKITDFGLARVGDDASLTQSGTVAGTPMYMSPEQANGETVDQRSDLFSLGSVLYVMCTGRAPFRANTTMAVMKRVCEDTPKAIRTVNADIPAWLEAIVTKLHAKKPGDRYQTATEVADVLGEHLAELQAGRAGSVSDRSPATQTMTALVPAAPTPVARSPGSPRRRRRVVAAALVLLLVAVAPVVLIATGTFDRFFEASHVGPDPNGPEPPKKDGVNPPAVDASDKNAPATLAKTYKNKLGMEFVLVPKGRSWLGGGAGKTGTLHVEIPYDFYLGTYEVTQEEWQNLMGKNPSCFSRDGRDKEAVKNVREADLKRFPVENISWYEAQEFIKLVNEKSRETGWEYRMPTELEWEYACRGGPMRDQSESEFDYYFDEATNQVAPAQANVSSNVNRTSKVGSYNANRLGLFDMH
ncbi:MAG: protein kinase, partial [Planctomycetes bacterium]|nr:protein kinase [Planctomycetota bacterium]